jgi:hypothetical protein
MSEWREKDDLELTFDDLGDMLMHGEPVCLDGPPLPGDALIVRPVPTMGAVVIMDMPAPGLLGGSVSVSHSISD